MGTVLIRGRTARFTLVDQCGTPLVGPYSTIITNGLITVQMTTALLTGQTIEVLNAAGEQMANDVPEPKFSYITSVITMGDVNPYLVNFLTGQELWNGATPGVATGFTEGTDVDTTTRRFAMELWSGTADDVCDEDSNPGYGYLLLPKNARGQLGDVAWGNNAINMVVNGANTKGGNQWGVGPYDDVALDDTDALSPLLQPIGSKKHRLVDIVYAPPPAAQDEPQPLGTKATSATAGTPGTHAPSGSWMPDTLAGMTGITASPATAWTTGQYVSLFNGDPVHWTGTAWAAGVA